MKRVKTDNLLVSFSGGETSAFMAGWLKEHAAALGYRNVVYVFANTGVEHPATYEFVRRCDEYFNLNLYWIEAKVTRKKGVGTSYKMTNYNEAARDGAPFREVVKKYGVPNTTRPHCTRELKQVPMSKFGRDYFNGEPYHTAIGIRVDEIDRMHERAGELGLIYPLISHVPMTKQKINRYWGGMPFRLEIPPYLGNCVACWKKSLKKLLKIAQECPEYFDFFAELEATYGGGEYTFYRGNRSAVDIIKMAKEVRGEIKIRGREDTAYQLSLFDSETCEPFSTCSFS